MEMSGVRVGISSRCEMCLVMEHFWGNFQERLTFYERSLPVKCGFLATVRRPILLSEQGKYSPPKWVASR